MKGFSLVEVLLTTLLLLLALGMIGTTAAEYARISRHAGGQDNQFEAAQRALSLIAGELKESVNGISPSSPAPVSTISFEKVDLRDDRFAPPAPAAFLPRQPRLTVLYQLSGNQLTRRQSDGVSTTTDTVAEGISGLSASLESPRRIRVRLEVETQGGSVAVEREVHLWTGPW